MTRDLCRCGAAPTCVVHFTGSRSGALPVHCCPHHAESWEKRSKGANWGVRLEVIR